MKRRSKELTNEFPDNTLTLQFCRNPAGALQHSSHQMWPKGRVPERESEPRAKAMECAGVVSYHSVWITARELKLSQSSQRFPSIWPPFHGTMDPFVIKS
ncbi:hypothetical protein AGIG_G22986 [Arapaima gigas]